MSDDLVASAHRSNPKKQPDLKITGAATAREDGRQDGHAQARSTRC
jgi:hypothetical protein